MILLKSFLDCVGLYYLTIYGGRQGSIVELYFEGRLLALSANIRLGWKWLAYCGMELRPYDRDPWKLR